MQEARLFGLEMSDADLHRSADDAGIWPWHETALAVFEACSTQWRVIDGMNGRRAIGLDYAAFDPVMDLMGVTATQQLFDEIRVIEAGALAALNGETR